MVDRYTLKVSTLLVIALFVYAVLNDAFYKFAALFGIYLFGLVLFSLRKDSDVFISQLFQNYEAYFEMEPDKSFEDLDSAYFSLETVEPGYYRYNIISGEGLETIAVLEIYFDND